MKWSILYQIIHYLIDTSVGSVFIERFCLTYKIPTEEDAMNTPRYFDDGFCHIYVHGKNKIRARERALEMIQKRGTGMWKLCGVIPIETDDWVYFSKHKVTKRRR